MRRIANYLLGMDDKWGRTRGWAFLAVNSSLSQS